MPISNEVLTGLGLVFGSLLAGLWAGFKSRTGKDVAKLQESVNGVVVPMKEIADNVSRLVTKVEVIETKVLEVQVEQQDVKREALAASIERRDVIKELSYLRGIEEGKVLGAPRSGARK